MKGLFRFCTPVLAILVSSALFFTACGGEKTPPETPKPKLELTLNRSEIELEYTEEAFLTADLTGGDETVVFTSSDPDVATVTADGYVGTVKGIAGGECVIKATAGTAEAECKVKVSSNIVLALSLQEVLLFRGDVTPIRGFLVGSTKTIQWSSSDESVATVTRFDRSNGTITAVGEGTCVITGKVDGAVARCNITVKEAENKPFAINLPANRIILKQTGAHATVKAIVKDSTVDPASLEWRVTDTSVATVISYENIAYLTAVAKGNCMLEVSYTPQSGEKISTACAVYVQKTVELPEEDEEVLETFDYYAYTANDVRSESTYHGLSNAISVLANNPKYGTGSYLTTTTDSTKKIFTYQGLPYNFLTHSGVYHGFDGKGSVKDGQSAWWQNWVYDLEIYKNDMVNMLQLVGQYKNSYYYRATDWNAFGDTGYEEDPNQIWGGWRGSVYAAAGAGVQYSGISNDAFGISGYEQVYDLSGSVMKPSQSSQNVFAEIWADVYYPTVTNGVTDGGGKDVGKVKYYGAYFNAGTAESTKELEDGAKGYWYAFEGYLDSEGGTMYSNPSVRTLSEEPIGYSVWNKQAGQWESRGLTIKINVLFRFSGMAGADDTAKVDYTVTGIQDEVTLSEEYVWDAGKFYAPTGETPVGISYGVSFTPQAPISENAYLGYYQNAEVPDLYNGGSWTGAKQVSVTGFALAGESQNADMSLITGTGAKYRAVWGKDVCSVVVNKQNMTTEINFRY